MHHSELYKKVINICGAPNSGKSTLAAYIYAEFKSQGYNCELVTEAAKIAVYENTKYKIWNQPLIFGEQLQGLLRVVDDVDFIITDSPLILGIAYNPDCFSRLNDLIEQSFSYFNNYCYILPVNNNFKQSGRRHNKKECIELQSKINNIVTSNTIEEKIVELKDHNLKSNMEIIFEHAEISNFLKK